jgi:ectoine hydroxylase
MEYQKLADQFWRDGYLVIENFFNDELMDQYHALILNHFGDDPQFSHTDEFIKKAATEVIPWFPQREGVHAFDEVENDLRLKKLTDLILGEGWYSLYCMTMYSRPGSKGQAWHQDCAPDDPKMFNMNRLMYTRDINADTGGETLVVPGSHKRGLLTVGDVNEEFADQRVLTPKKGMLILLHGHTWHRVYPTHIKERVSTNYRCSPAGTPEDITDICVYRNMRYKFAINQVVEERV